MTLYVNGEQVDDSRITAEAERLRPDYEKAFADQSPEEQKTQLLDWSRENIIEHVLLRQAANKKIDKIDPTVVDNAYSDIVEKAGGPDKFFEQIGMPPEEEPNIKADIEAQMRLEIFVRELTEKAPKSTDKQIKKYYEKNSDQFIIPESIRASHIVKHPSEEVTPEQAKEQADKIHAEIVEKDNFEEMAGQHSDCPENAGNLGYFSRGQMVQNFEDVVFNMEVGQTSEVFETEFGFHIAKLTDKKPQVQCPFEEVKEFIEKQLTQEAQQKAIEKFVDAEKKNATIEDK
jgi:parvulin-like peptidyl-prolyl isomerase